MDKKIITVIAVVTIIIITIIYINFEGIEKYINNKEWEFADSIATIQLDKILQVESGNDLIALTSNNISIYKDSNRSQQTIDVVTTEITTDASGEYTAIADKKNGTIYMLKGGEAVWEKKVNGEIYTLVVNKNGYSAAVYNQAGYKSVIKVIKPNGEEAFTTFLASTYAVDIAISNDNKHLAIAELNGEGIKIASSIKIIKIDEIDGEVSKNIPLENNSLVLDVEYNENNELLIMKDSGISIVNEEKTNENIVEYTYHEVAFSTIENSNNIILIKKVGSGIFGTECVLQIYEKELKEEYELNTTPQNICVQNKTIAINMGTEVLFIGTNGNLIKRYSLGSQLKEIKLYQNGKMAALVFRDRIELVKI